MSLFLGVIIGSVGGMIGLAGGFLMVPYLNLLLGFPMRIAVGTSLLASIFTSTSAGVTYLCQKRVDFKLAVFMALMAVPSSLFGAYLTQFVTSEILRIVFGIILAYASLNMMLRKTELKQSPIKTGFLVWKRRFIDRAGRVFDYSIDVLLALAGGIIIGLTSGFMGVGGGVIGVPYLTMVLGMPVYVAMATTIFMSIFVALGGSAEHLSLGNVSFPLVLFLGAGLAVGGYIGAKLAPRIKALTIKKIFGVFLLFIALRMILLV